MSQNNYGQYPSAPPPSTVGGMIGGAFQQQPSYPQQPGYQQPAYPSPQQPGYPSQPPSSGYPNQQPGYPSAGYPSQNPSIYPSLPGYQPQAPTYPPQQPGYPSSQPGYPQAGYPSSGYPSSQPGYPQPGFPGQPRWDEQSFLRRLFDEIDQNRDGRITLQELGTALKRGHTSSEFDPYTVNVLLEKYDRDRDGQVVFDEFQSLFGDLNSQYNEFLDFDTDNSGTIDGRELSNIMRRKGHNYSPDLFQYVAGEIARRSGKPGISFDTYVRCVARFDFLRNQYQRSGQNSMPLEAYVRNYFF